MLTQVLFFQTDCNPDSDWTFNEEKILKMNWSPIAPNDALHSTVNDMLEILFQNIGFIKLILDGFMRAH